MTDVVRAARRLAGDAPRARQSGQAMLEFAGAVTVLLLLVVGVIELAPALVRSAQLTQAVRDGVTYGRWDPGDTAGIRSRVKQSATTMTIADANVTITCRQGLLATGTVITCSSAQPGDSVEVRAQFNYQLVTSRFSSMLAAPIEISRSATSEIY